MPGKKTHPTSAHLVIGKQAEHIAHEYLTNQGLLSIAKNYTTRIGEIDLIMKDADILVFVEVRFRKNINFGLPQETVSIYKQKKIIQTANLFLVEKKLSDQCTCRFDIVAIHGTIPDHQINWIPDAFHA